METVKIQEKGLLQKRITDLENYQIQLDKLREVEKIVLKSELKDIDTIYKVYDWVTQLCNEREEINNFRYDTKHYFLIIAALLYSPRIFAGQFLERGKRDVIADVLNLSPSHISNSLRSVCSWYKFYRDFQSSLDYLYSEILNRIEINGLR